MTFSATTAVIAVCAIAKANARTGCGTASDGGHHVAIVPTYPAGVHEVYCWALRDLVGTQLQPTHSDNLTTDLANQKLTPTHEIGCGNVPQVPVVIGNFDKSVGAFKSSHIQR
jgi:hypothetical protein